MEVKLAPVNGPQAFEVRQGITTDGELCTVLVLQLPGQCLVTYWEPGVCTDIGNALLEADALTVAGVAVGPVEGWGQAPGGQGGADGPSGGC